MAPKAQVTPPKHIQVSGLTWKIRRRAKLTHSGEEVYGLIFPDTQEIHLSGKALANADRARKTLVHESMHAALVGFPQYYDENLITILEEKVDELIRLNPQLMEMYGYVRHGE